MLTQEVLKRFITYEKVTGKFFWNYDSKHHSKGDPAGSILSKGKYKRLRISVDGKQYFAARLAILYETGEWPTGMVDHINHDTLDDRLENLKDVSNQENQFNQKSPHTGANGKYLGVSFYKNTGRYQARIAVNKVQKHLGYFDTPEEAWETYKLAKKKYHGIVL